MNPIQLKALIQKVLLGMNKYSSEAVELLMLTAAQESHCGEYITQIGGGPALGIFQMEPATMRDIFDNYLNYRKPLKQSVEMFSSGSDLDLEGNILFQIALARVHYLRVPEAIPKRQDFQGSDAGFDLYVFAMARYWKKYWNTDKGKGTVREAFDNYNRYYLGGV
jgi:hypothetical protein